MTLKEFIKNLAFEDKMKLVEQFVANSSDIVYLNDNNQFVIEDYFGYKNILDEKTADMKLWVDIMSCFTNENKSTLLKYYKSKRTDTLERKNNLPDFSNLDISFNNYENIEKFESFIENGIEINEEKKNIEKLEKVIKVFEKIEKYQKMSKELKEIEKNIKEFIEKEFNVNSIDKNLESLLLAAVKNDNFRIIDGISRIADKLIVLRDNIFTFIEPNELKENDIAIGQVDVDIFNIHNNEFIISFFKDIYKNNLALKDENYMLGEEILDKADEEIFESSLVEYDKELRGELIELVNNYIDNEKDYLAVNDIVDILMADEDRKNSYLTSQEYFQKLNKTMPESTLEYNKKEDTLLGDFVRIDFLVVRDGKLMFINTSNNEQNKWYNDLEDNDILLGMKVKTENYEKMNDYPVSSQTETKKLFIPQVFRKEFVEKLKMENTLDNKNDIKIKR